VVKSLIFLFFLVTQRRGVFSFVSESLTISPELPVVSFCLTLSLGRGSLRILSSDRAIGHPGGFPGHLREPVDPPTGSEGNIELLFFCCFFERAGFFRHWVGFFPDKREILFPILTRFFFLFSPS